MDERDLYEAISEWKIIPLFGCWLVPADSIIPELRDRFPSLPHLQPFIAWPALEDDA